MISPELEARMRKNGWEGEITADRLLEELPVIVEEECRASWLTLDVLKKEPKVYRAYYELYDHCGNIEATAENPTEALSELFCKLKEKNLI